MAKIKNPVTEVLFTDGAVITNSIVKLQQDTFDMRKVQSSFLDCYFPNCTYFNKHFGSYPQNDNCEKIRLTLSNDTTIYSGSFSYNSYKNYELEINFSTKKCTNISKIVDNHTYTNYGCTKITGVPLDFTSNTDTSMLLSGEIGGGSFEIISVLFVENTLKVSKIIQWRHYPYGKIYHQPFVQTANVLKNGVVGKVLSMDNADLRVYQAILGVYETRIKSEKTVGTGNVSTDLETFKTAVSDVHKDYFYTFNGTDWVDENSNVVNLTTLGITLSDTPVANDVIQVQLYDFFTEDPSGTMSLEEFITTVKGWTLS